jgi:hypothetical protein
MAGASSPIQRQQELQRGFEFSRLHEDWIASVYALVVPGRGLNRCEQASCGSPRSDKTPAPERANRAERRAG